MNDTGQPLNDTDITVSWDFYDPDSTGQLAEVQWYRAGELQEDLTEYIFDGVTTTAVLSNLKTNESDLWYARVIAGDTYSWGNGKRSGAVYVLPKTNPVITGPSNQTIELTEAQQGSSLEFSVYDPVYNFTGCYVTLWEGITKRISNQTWRNNQPIIYEYCSLNPVTHNYRLEVGDGFDGFSVYEVFIDVYNDDPEILDGPDLQSITVGDTGNEITWIATDSGVSQRRYYLYENLTQKVNKAPWENGEDITYNIDGLDPGSYNFSIHISDEYGGHSYDYIIVNVLNPVPFISNPQDIEFEITTTSPMLSWSVVDETVKTNQLFYNITRNGELIHENIAWVSGNTISSDLSSLAVGDYTYIITLNDGYDGIIYDEVEVSITNSNPFVSKPSDISFLVDSTVHTLTWSIVDDSISSGSQGYTITQNDAIIKDNIVWTTGDVISIDLDNLSEGTYLFVISFEDGYGGTIEDSVTVVIGAESTQPSNLLIIGIVVGLIVGVVSAFVISKVKKKDGNVERSNAAGNLQSNITPKSETPENTITYPKTTKKSTKSTKATKKPTKSTKATKKPTKSTKTTRKSTKSTKATKK